MITRPRYASAQDAARAAAEAAQIIKRNEAQNTEQREVWHHARAEFDRLTSLTPNLTLASGETSGPATPPFEVADHASDCALHNGPAYPAGPCDCGYENGYETVGGSSLSWRADPPGSVTAGCPIGPETPAE